MNCNRGSCINEYSKLRRNRENKILNANINLEPCNPDNELINAFYAFEKEFHNQFLTTYGLVNGQIITTILNNAAAMHGFTDVNPYNQQAQEKSHLFTFYSR
jgi:hypothetical protein